jgi:AcrR family transcriptional regulator
MAAKSTSTARTTSPREINGIPARPRDREVLDAAATVFARYGYAAATVQHVAEELGILKGSLYYYIKTKEDLLFRLLLEVHEESDALLKKVAERDGLTPLAMLQEYVRAQTTFNLRNLVKIKVYYNDVDQLSEERRAEVLGRRRLHEAFVTRLIGSAQQTGEVSKKLDATLMANSVFAVIIWPYRWYRPRGRLKADDVVEACVDFVTYGLTKR